MSLDNKDALNLLLGEEEVIEKSELDIAFDILDGDLEKGRDTSKLTKKVITNKLGHKQTVYVSTQPDEPKAERAPKQDGEDHQEAHTEKEKTEVTKKPTSNPSKPTKDGANPNKKLEDRYKDERKAETGKSDWEKPKATGKGMLKQDAIVSSKYGKFKVNSTQKNVEFHGEDSDHYIISVGNHHDLKIKKSDVHHYRPTKKSEDKLKPESVKKEEPNKPAKENTEKPKETPKESKKLSNSTVYKQPEKGKDKKPAAPASEAKTGDKPKPAPKSTAQTKESGKKAPTPAAKKGEDHKGGAKISEVLKKHLKNFTAKQEAFFKDGEHEPNSETRKSLGDLIRKKIKGIGKAIVHEVHEIKTAGTAVKKLMNSEKLDDHEKHALKAVAKHLAITVGTMVLTGGVGHLFHGVGSAAGAIVTHYLEHAGLTAVGKALLFAKAEEGGETEEMDEKDASEWIDELVHGLAEYVEKGDISDEEWVKIMEESDGINKTLGLDKHIEKEEGEDDEDDTVTISKKDFAKHVSDGLDTLKKGEDTKDFAYKGYMGKSLGMKRENMPQIDPTDIDSFIIHFSGKNINVRKVTRKIKDLKPTQDDINDYKILEKIKGKSDWKGRKYIMSLDGYLLDGHHDWATGLEFDPEQKVDVYRVNLPIKKLVHRTNKMKISSKRDSNDKTIEKGEEMEKGKRYEYVDVSREGKTFKRRQLVGTDKVEQPKVKTVTKQEEPPKGGHGKGIKKPKEPRKPQWYDEITSKYSLNRLPVGIPKEKVTIHKGDVSNHWVMSWYDEKQGRNQFAYTREFLQRNAQNKWARIKDIKSSQIDLIRKQTSKMVGNATEDKKKQAAAIIHIISMTGLRPGDRMLFKRTKNRGVSTLSPDNIKITGSKIKFNFIGKSYQENNAEVDNAELAKYLTKLKKEKKGEEFLFDVDKKGIMTTFRTDLGFKGLKLKDMRTYVATDEARKILANNTLPPPPKPENSKGLKKLIQAKLTDCFEKVSQKLNNTPAMAKSSYIHPAVIESFLVSLGAKKEDFMKAEEDDTTKDKMLDGIISSNKRYGVKEKAVDVTEEEDEDLDITFALPDWWDSSLD